MHGDSQIRFNIHLVMRLTFTYIVLYTSACFVYACVGEKGINIHENLALCLWNTADKTHHGSVTKVLAVNNMTFVSLIWSLSFGNKSPRSVKGLFNVVLY